MTSAEAAPTTSPCAEAHLWECVRAAGVVTRDTGMPTVVLLPRRQGIVSWARYVAGRLGTSVAVEVTADGVELRFQPLSDDGAPRPDDLEEQAVTRMGQRRTPRRIGGVHRDR